MVYIVFRDASSKRNSKFIVDKELICSLSSMVRMAAVSRYGYLYLSFREPKVLAGRHPIIRKPQVWLGIYLQFIHAIQPGNLRQIASAFYVELSGSVFEALSEPEAMVYFYCRCWRIGQYLGDDAFSNSAMDCLLQEEYSRAAVTFITRNGIKCCLGKTGSPYHGGLWRWMADCVAAWSERDDFEILWDMLKGRDGLGKAVLEKLVGCRGRRIEAPMFAARDMYQENNEGESDVQAAERHEHYAGGYAAIQVD